MDHCPICTSEKFRTISTAVSGYFGSLPYQLESVEMMHCDSCDEGIYTRAQTAAVTTAIYDYLGIDRKEHKEKHKRTIRIFCDHDSDTNLLEHKTVIDGEVKSWSILERAANMAEEKGSCILEFHDLYQVSPEFAMKVEYLKGRLPENITITETLSAPVYTDNPKLPTDKGTVFLGTLSGTYDTFDAFLVPHNDTQAITIILSNEEADALTRSLGRVRDLEGVQGGSINRALLWAWRRAVTLGLID